MTILNDILDFSKIEAGKLSLESAPFDLRDAVEECVSLLSVRAHEKGLELLIQYPPGVPTKFLGDPGRLRQVVTNLVGNAIKFTSEGEISVTVGCESEGGGSCLIRCEVADSGIGIPADKIDYVFDKFTQADTSTTRKFGGTGLGLAICRQLIGLMGGRSARRASWAAGRCSGSRSASRVTPAPKPRQCRPRSSKTAA